MKGDLFGDRARLTPDKTALIEVPGGRRYTYAELDVLTSSFAAQLSEHGVGRGDRYGILAESRAEYVAAFLAAGKCGAIAVPLNTRLHDAELQAIAEDAGLALLFYSAATARRSVTAPIRVSFDQPRPPARWNENIGMEAEDPWCLLYTSGTTGQAKGVIIPHRMVWWNAMNTALSWQLRDSDTGPIFTPLYHAGGLFVLLTPLIAVGGTVILHAKFDAREVWRAIERERVTILFGVPTTYAMLTAEADFQTARLEHLRWAISGGAPLPQPLMQRWKARGVVLKQGFGMTEAGVNCFAMTRGDALLKSGSIGKPMMGHEVRLVTEEGAEAATDEAGELWMRGPHVASGYWNRPEATRETFGADGWLRTGDLMRRDADGFFYVAGRKKDMFISGGVNVYPSEIEAVLRDHNAVIDAAVVGVGHELWGECGAAFLEVRECISKRELVAWLESRLAHFKTPKEFHVLKAFPRTALGKVAKPELLQMRASGRTRVLNE